MEILWTRQASTHLASAHAYLRAAGSLAAAENQVEVILLAVEQLSNFPVLGRPGRVDGTRELVVQGTPYVVAYRVRKRSVRVLAILHGARRWPISF